MSEKDKEVIQGCGCLIGIGLIIFAAIVLIAAVGFRIATS